MTITKDSKNIKIPQVSGPWHVIDSTIYHGEKIFLFENEIFSDGLPCMIVDKEGEILLNNVYNGFNDLFL